MICKKINTVENSPFKRHRYSPLNVSSLVPMLIINGYIFDMATLAVQSTRVSAPYTKNRRVRRCAEHN